MKVSVWNTVFVQMGQSLQDLREELRDVRRCEGSLDSHPFGIEPHKGTPFGVFKNKEHFRVPRIINYLMQLQ